jgi:hypothetical protein
VAVLAKFASGTKKSANYGYIDTFLSVFLVAYAFITEGAATRRLPNYSFGSRASAPQSPLRVATSWRRRQVPPTNCQLDLNIGPKKAVKRAYIQIDFTF